jgi:hypothetical protein
VPISDLKKPKVLFNDDIDIHNTNTISEYIKKYLEDLNNIENTLWKDYEMGDDFKCEYLDCEAITISHFIVERGIVPTFLISRQKKGFLD